MADGAQYALNSWIRAGMPRRVQKRNKPVRVKCPECGKEVNGKASLMQHENAKHSPKKYTWAEICRVQDKEWYG